MTPPSPCESQKVTKIEPCAWGYKWATLSLAWSPRLGGGRKADDLCTKNCCNIQKTGCNHAEFAKEGYGLRSNVFPTTIL
jgi:hypothetical protein